MCHAQYCIPIVFVLAQAPGYPLRINGNTKEDRPDEGEEEKNEKQSTLEDGKNVLTL